jgi:hypothetical protein
MNTTTPTDLTRIWGGSTAWRDSVLRKRAIPLCKTCGAELDALVLKLTNAGPLCLDCRETVMRGLRAYEVDGPRMARRF